MVSKSQEMNLPEISPVDWSFAEQCWEHLHKKCIPPDSLGCIERAAVRISCIMHTVKPDLGTPYVLIAAGDHGVYQQQVSFAPQDVSWQHSLNIAHGGGVSGMLCRRYGLPLALADVGLKHSFQSGEGIVDCKVAWGCADISEQDAMSSQECAQAIAAGRRQVQQISEEGFRTIIFGEMGIGNTTPAAAITVALLQESVEQCVGKGTGMSAQALAHKRQVVSSAVARYRAQKSSGSESAEDPFALLASLGGLELAFMVGGMLEAAGRQMVILLDGVIVSAAALVAQAINPLVVDYMVSCHCSHEPAHKLQLMKLGLEPLLSMGLCLGEASGAIIAWPLLETAQALMVELNSFDEGGLDDANKSILAAMEA